MERIVNKRNPLFNRKQPNCIVLYIEEWSSIVQNVYLVKGCHLSIKNTLAKIGKKKLLIGNNIQGLSKSFIKEVVKTCVGYKF